MKYIYSITIFLHLLPLVIHAQIPDEYDSFTINYPWSSEFQFRIYDNDGQMILPENMDDGSFEMHSVLPQTKGEYSLRFDISSDYFIYSQTSGTELLIGWVFIIKKDTMSISIPNYPTIMGIDSIPFSEGQFFVSEDEFNAVNLQSRAYHYSDHHEAEFGINRNILKKLDLSNIESFRFDKDNYEQKSYPNDEDMYQFDGYYKANNFGILSHLKDSVNIGTELFCEIIELPVSIPFDFIATDYFLNFNADSSFIINNKNDLEEALGENKLNINIDFSKEIILHTLVGGDCDMSLRHQVILDRHKKIITWVIYNFWGGCRAGGMKSTWIKIAKPDEGFEVDVDVILVE